MKASCGHEEPKVVNASTLNPEPSHDAEEAITNQRLIFLESSRAPLPHIPLEPPSGINGERFALTASPRLSLLVHVLCKYFTSFAPSIPSHHPGANTATGSLSTLFFTTSANTAYIETT
ncbi:hypothetical protein E2C01_045197 [Portunus trituberculatus]|uniref:Uncharacterized protein n=1 Tax=Portunus trituberculatus TaxID=210409 RepID=A0A5B7G262_PORTR|nr:hypothetical protein [Portunus trituberculatus]